MPNNMVHTKPLPTKMPSLQCSRNQDGRKARTGRGCLHGFTWRYGKGERLTLQVGVHSNAVGDGVQAERVPPAGGERSRGRVARRRGRQEAGRAPRGRVLGNDGVQPQGARPQAAHVTGGHGQQVSVECLQNQKGLGF